METYRRWIYAKPDLSLLDQIVRAVSGKMLLIKVGSLWHQLNILLSFRNALWKN